MLVLRVDVDSQRLAVPVGVEIAVLVDRRQCPLEHVAVPLVVALSGDASETERRTQMTVEL